MKSAIVSVRSGAPVEFSEPKYGEMHLRGDQIKETVGDISFEPGKVYEGTVRFKVSAWSSPEQGEPSLTLCILGMEGVEDTGETVPKKSEKSEKPEEYEEGEEKEYS